MPRCMRKAITQRRTNCRARGFRETGLRNDLNSGSASCMISTGGSFLSVWRMVPFVTTILPKSAERREPPAQTRRKKAQLQNLLGPGLSLTGRPHEWGYPRVEGHAPSPLGVSRVAWISVYRHAVVITPVARWVLIARGTAYSTRFPFIPSDGGLPRASARSATTLDFSRPAQRSLALRPVGSLHRQSDTSVSKAPTVSLPPPPLR